MLEFYFSKSYTLSLSNKRAPIQHFFTMTKHPLNQGSQTQSMWGPHFGKKRARQMRAAGRVFETPALNCASIVLIRFHELTHEIHETVFL